MASERPEPPHENSPSSGFEHAADLQEWTKELARQGIDADDIAREEDLVKQAHEEMDSEDTRVAAEHIAYNEIPWSDQLAASRDAALKIQDPKERQARLRELAVQAETEVQQIRALDEQLNIQTTGEKQAADAQAAQLKPKTDAVIDEMERYYNEPTLSPEQAANRDEALRVIDAATIESQKTAVEQDQTAQEILADQVHDKLMAYIGDPENAEQLLLIDTRGREDPVLYLEAIPKLYERLGLPNPLPQLDKIKESRFRRRDLHEPTATASYVDSGPNRALLHSQKIWNETLKRYGYVVFADKYDPAKP